MLVEPGDDPARQALDRTVLDAVEARLGHGAPTAPDAEAIALRDLADVASPAARRVLRALWGRMDPAPPLACGPLAERLVADRWGLAVGRAPDADSALKAVADGSRALIDLTGVKAWWGRLLARPDIRIVAALPDDAAAMPRALLAARQTSGPTGDDRTFWVTDSPLPDAAVVQALALCGLAATPLSAAGGLKLFMLAGYVQAGDGRLTGAPGALSGVIGAAPVFAAPVFRDQT